MRSASRVRGRALACALVAGGFLAVGAGQAQAAGLGVLSVSKKVQAGKTGTLALRLSSTVPMTCTVILSRAGKTRSSRPVQARRSRLVWSWQVPPKSRSGRVLVRATCAQDAGSFAKTVTRRFRIIGTRSGTQLPARRLRAQVSGSPFMRAQDEDLADPVADEPAVIERPTQGGCTVWARYKRPDLKIYTQADMWDDEARARGFTVDSVPRVGDIAVWEAEQVAGGIRAGSVGHVAYVESVGVDGTLDISEFNVVVKGGYGERKGMDPAGLVFIHRK